MKDNLQLINFIDTTLEEREMILTWRNHESIRKWMFNTNEISRQEHFAFIERLKNRQDRLYFMVKRDDDYIGIVDITNIDFLRNTAELGLYGKPGLNGVGKILMSSICEYAFKELNLIKLIAEVFSANKKAIKLYKDFNFKEFKVKEMAGKNIICMELKNENS